MKRIVLYLALGVGVLCLVFPLVWLIVRIVAQDFPALGFASRALSLAISFILTGYIVRDAMRESKLVAHELENQQAQSAALAD